MDGNIYDNSCYYQCDLNNLPSYLDKEKMCVNNSFIQKTVDDFSIELSHDEIQQYKIMKKIRSR